MGCHSTALGAGARCVLYAGADDGEHTIDNLRAQAKSSLTLDEGAAVG